MLVWVWLIKAVGVVILNLYFVSVWMVQRGRYYHWYDTEEEVDQELLYIYFGVANIALQIIFGFIFCCTAGGFTYQVKN